MFYSLVHSTEMVPPKSGLPRMPHAPCLSPTYTFHPTLPRLVLPLLVPRVRLADNVEVPVVSLAPLPPNDLLGISISELSIHETGATAMSHLGHGSRPRGVSHLAMLAPLLDRAVNLHPPDLLKRAAGNKAVALRGNREGRPGR